MSRSASRPNGEPARRASARAYHSRGDRGRPLAYCVARVCGRLDHGLGVEFLIGRAASFDEGQRSFQDRAERAVFVARFSTGRQGHPRRRLARVHGQREVGRLGCSSGRIACGRERNHGHKGAQLEQLARMREGERGQLAFIDHRVQIVAVGARVQTI